MVLTCSPFEDLLQLKFNRTLNLNFFEPQQTAMHANMRFVLVI